MNSPVEKVLIIGVGNSGTSFLGSLVHGLLQASGPRRYYYEPLYWRGHTGKQGITLDRAAIAEHVGFPLLPEASVASWPWMDRFLERLDGMAKFIRAGSRIRLIIKHDVRILWITRNLYSFLASMQKNFPRCEPNAGWHHRPGEYDDFDRLRDIYKGHALSAESSRRIEVEAAWWHLHNAQMHEHAASGKILHVRYEDLCANQPCVVERVATFLGIGRQHISYVLPVRRPVERELLVTRGNLEAIERLAGPLNVALYGQDPGAPARIGDKA